MKRNLPVLSLIFIVTVLSCSTGNNKNNTLSNREKARGWELLFDGRSLDKWKMFNGGDVTGWKIVNGELHNSGTGSFYGGDIITKKQFSNFELYIEWKVTPQSESGIFYLVEEGITDSINETGLEFQLIDDLGWHEPLKDLDKSGALKGIYQPSDFVAKPLGKWNTSRLIVKNQHVEHWLNNKKVTEYELWSDKWYSAKQAGEWSEAPHLGEAKSGHIGLEDHGGLTMFRNVKIKEL